MTPLKIYLDMSYDIETLLDANKIAIADILRKENIDADTTHGVLPYQPEEGAKNKEIITIILAGIGAVGAIVAAISQAVSTLQDRAHYIRVSELTELKNDKGETLLDKSGTPKLRLVDKLESVESTEVDLKKRFEFKLGLSQGLVIRFSSEKKVVNRGME